MQLHLHWRDDIDKFLARHQQPVVLLPRPKTNASAAAASVYQNRPDAGRTGEFWTPKSAISAVDIDWVSQDVGDYVSIPMWAYDINKRSRSLLIASAAELGMRAAFSLAQRCQNPPIDCHLVLGVTCDRVGNGYRYFMGMTIRTK